MLAGRGLAAMYILIGFFTSRQRVFFVTDSYSDIVIDPPPAVELVQIEHLNPGIIKSHRAIVIPLDMAR